MSVEYHGKPNPYTFEMWEKEVDNIILAQFGLGPDHFADWPSRDTYDDELSPMEGAEVWVEYMDDYEKTDMFSVTFYHECPKWEEQ